MDEGLARRVSVQEMGSRWTAKEDGPEGGDGAAKADGPRVGWLINKKCKINDEGLVCMCGIHISNYFISVILFSTENNLKKHQLNWEIFF